MKKLHVRTAQQTVEVSHKKLRNLTYPTVQNNLKQQFVNNKHSKPYQQEINSIKTLPGSLRGALTLYKNNGNWGHFILLLRCFLADFDETNTIRKFSLLSRFGRRDIIITSLLTIFFLIFIFIVKKYF